MICICLQDDSVCVWIWRVDDADRQGNECYSDRHIITAVV